MRGCKVRGPGVGRYGASVIDEGVEPSRPARPGPLHGVRVLDLTRVLSGPHCTRMLCDLGADVIKVEPPDGDLTRFTNPRINGLASYFIQQNTGKRNISVDMTNPDGVELLLRLANRCDVLVENFRPGVMERMGLGHETVAARAPSIVYASITGYGRSGPWVHRRAYAPVVGAETGITRMQGDARDGAYVNDPWSHADLYTSLECATAILAALFQRERTGRGERIDVSMAQTMLYVNEHAHDQLWDGPVDPAWIRSFGAGAYPVLTAANGEQVIISGHPAERGAFELFMRGMSLTHLVDDPRFVDVPTRLANFDVLVQYMRDWAITIADPEAIEAALAEHGLATGTIRTTPELCDTDWAVDRGAVVAVSDRGHGAVRVPDSPWRFAGSDTGVRGTPRYRGEDNRAVLAELLSLGDDELADLEARRVLVSRVPAR